MKKIILTLAIVASAALSACKFNPTHNNISITTQDNPGHLNFTANYPENKTGATQTYMESFFKEDRIFKSVSDAKKVEVTLKDGTQFYLSYEPGFISINFDRDKNSYSSYLQMKKMISGFGNVLKD
ncbi:hypothetical protein WG904_09645 [Pedobacter sp. Du54]|uniref:hypothetical protein n=1 Tax=Pedobacter anseongensis TaxID=3133439 RepID=UPI0030A03923